MEMAFMYVLGLVGGMDGGEFWGGTRGRRGG